MIEIKLSALKESRPHEYAMRFLFGGLCTVLAGLIAKRWGPGVGGLFLAFPAIFPASASLIESHEKRRKKEAGLDGTLRGRLAAGLDSSGSVLGCVALLTFAAALWIGLPGRNAYVVITVATSIWVAVAGALWWVRRSHFWVKR
jgi:hypothetical protein